MLQTCRHACCVYAWLDQCTVRRSSHLWWVFPHCQRRQHTCMPVLTWLKKSATAILPILVRWFLSHYTLFFILSLETDKAKLQGSNYSYNQHSNSIWQNTSCHQNHDSFNHNSHLVIFLAYYLNATLCIYTVSSPFLRFQMEIKL